MTKSAIGITAFATLTDDPWLNLASAVIAASAVAGDIDELVPILDEHLYAVTNRPHAATALALKCYLGARNSPTGYRASTVRQRREQCGLTVLELATRIGISKGAISSIENLGSTPSAAIQTQLAEALQCTVAELWPSN